jgi:hypothetical protein
VDDRHALATVTGPLAEPERVAFAGCWHGNTNYAKKAIRHAADQGATAIVHTGDLGYWVRSAAMEALSVTLYQHGLRMLWVDGDHDDHPGLAHLAPDGHGLHPVADQIWHLPRGYRWTWASLRFLAMGGARSIDRRFRTPGQDWWPQEAITTTQALAAISQGPADVMVTHDCPSGVTPAGLVSPLPAAWIPEEPSADAHRTLLGSVVDEVGPAWLIHGHYHARYTTHRSGPARICRVEGLSREGDSLTNNLVVLDLAEMNRVTVLMSAATRVRDQAVLEETDADLAGCTCRHTVDTHLRRTGRCRGTDSYGQPCACPSFDLDREALDFLKPGGA